VRRAGLLRPALALIAVIAIVPQVVVLSAGVHLNNSHAAAAASDPARAQREALAAKAVEPWAASPYLQLGLLAQDEGQYADARRWLGLAIDRSRQNWVLWYTASQIDKNLGELRVAARECEHARALNPRGSVFKDSPCKA
jgi:tetratricopeptide (TPR) repeat protein